MATELTQIVGTLAAVYGWFVAPVGWHYALLVWAYALLWFLFNSGAKIVAVRLLDHRVKRQSVHLERAEGRLAQ